MSPVPDSQAESTPPPNIGVLHHDIERVRTDADFRPQLKRLVERDDEILDRLAE